MTTGRAGVFYSLTPKAIEALEELDRAREAKRITDEEFRAMIANMTPTQILQKLKETGDKA